MKKQSGILIFFWLIGGLAIPTGWSAVQKDDLQIGTPDLPRRIQYTFPEIRPDQEIRFGALRLHPSFESKVEYDDNIRLASEDEKEDVIFSETPALGVEVFLGDHRIEAGYGMEILTFAKEQEENTTNHLAHALFEMNFNDFQLTIQDAVEKSTSRAFSETSARDKLAINTVDVQGRYDRPRWAAEASWRHNTVDHLVDTLEVNDYEEDVFAVLAGYKILPKTLLLLEVDTGIVTYHRTGNANQSYWQIFSGFRGEPTEKLSLTAKIGFQDRQLGDVPGFGPQDDYDGLVANIDVLYLLSQEDIWRLGYIRTVRTSTFADNSWYRQDRVYTSYARRFFRKWVISPQFGWQVNDYPELSTAGGSTKRREDSFWLTGVELRYEIQEWLTTGLAYRFRSRNSNLDSFDFNNNRIIFDVTLAY